jgi:hypothetical protein
MNDRCTDELVLANEISDEALEEAANEKVGMWTCCCTCDGCPNSR